MTNEQREAIEICKEKIIESFYDFPNPTSIELKDTDVEAIDIALSLIKEQEIYIKKYNDTTEEMNRDIRKLISEIQKKDKQIDLMAGLIGQDMMCIRPEIECNKMTHDCKECIKQYFERKVKK